MNVSDILMVTPNEMNGNASVDSTNLSRNQRSPYLNNDGFAVIFVVSSHWSCNERNITLAEELCEKLQEFEDDRPSRKNDKKSKSSVCCFFS